MQEMGQFTMDSKSIYQRQKSHVRIALHFLTSEEKEMLVNYIQFYNTTYDFTYQQRAENKGKQDKNSQ
jgi:hypothetical protein